MCEKHQIRMMNWPNMFRKKIPFGRILPPFFFESSESDRFFNYLHDSNSIFRAGRINSENISGGTKRGKQSGMGPKDPRRKERTYSWQKSMANSRQEMAKTGCGTKTASLRISIVAHTCNDVFQVGKQSQVPRSRRATMSQQHHLRCTRRRIDRLTRQLCQVVEGQRKHRAAQGSRGASTGVARHRRCSGFRGSAVAVHRRDHRHHCLGVEGETQ